MALRSVIKRLAKPAMSSEMPASVIAWIVELPKNLEKILMPPTAAVICGNTINMLKSPIIMPILLGFTELDNMAYGIERMLPQATPIKMNEMKRFCGDA